MRQSQRIDGPVWSVGGHGTTTHRVCKTPGYKIRGIFLKTCRLGASLDLPELWGIVDGLGITGGRCQLEKAGPRLFGTGLLRIGEVLGDGAWRGLGGQLWASDVVKHDRSGLRTVGKSGMEVGAGTRRGADLGRGAAEQAGRIEAKD
jgi:hypothetical protein